MSRPVRPDPALSARVRELAESQSIARVSRALKLAEGTVARIAGGLPVTEGTALLAARRLEQLRKGEGSSA